MHLRALGCNNDKTINSWMRHDRIREICCCITQAGFALGSTKRSSHWSNGSKHSHGKGSLTSLRSKGMLQQWLVHSFSVGAGNVGEDHDTAVRWGVATVIGSQFLHRRGKHRGVSQYNGQMGSQFLHRCITSGRITSLWSEGMLQQGLVRGFSIGAGNVGEYHDPTVRGDVATVVGS